MNKGSLFKRLSFKAFVVVALLCLSTVQVSAEKGPQGVSNTVHNLSGASPSPSVGLKYGADEGWVCVFCHTPHGGTLEGPLWNHVTPENVVGSFTHYNSVTLSDAIRVDLAANRVLGDESLICMACHDGSISVYSVHNINNDRSTPYESLYNNPGETELDIVGIPGTSTARIGGNPQDNDHNGNGRLDDDHPISFGYQDVLDDGAYNGGGKDGQLHIVDDAVAAGVRFFGGAELRVECSSCHDPHVDYPANSDWAPFLITPNTGSALCLACHNK